MKNPDVPLEIGIQHRQLVHRNVEDGCVLHDSVVFVAELLAGHHHVVHGSTQLPADSVCSLLPFTTRLGHKKAPAAECFCVRTDDAVGTGHENGVKRPADAAFLGAGDVAGADLEAWIEAAVCGESLGVGKTARSTDES